MARENEEGRSRSQELLNPDEPETREEWNATQVAAHEKLFRFSDSVTTLMFTGASDLSEAQRDRRTSFLSTEVDVSACTFVNVRVAFEELFCTPRSSVENPSLRTSRYSDPLSRLRSLYRTLIVDMIEKKNLDSGRQMNWLASKATLTMKIYASGHGTTVGLHGKPGHSRAVS